MKAPITSWSEMARSHGRDAVIRHQAPAKSSPVTRLESGDLRAGSALFVLCSLLFVLCSFSVRPLSLRKTAQTTPDCDRGIGPHPIARPDFIERIAGDSQAATAMRRIFGSRKEKPPAPTLDQATDKLNTRGDA
jgi:hypothetical protein